MKITPPLSCKMYSNLKCKSAAKSFSFGLILHILAFAAIVFSGLLCCLLSSCSANDDGSGSLTIAMPAASSSSRSIASSGPFQREDLAYMTFSVYLRDEDNNEVEKYTGLAQGSTLTIDQLRAGTYNIAIRGIDDGEVRFYGATEAVVKGGTENTARIVMEAVEADNEIFFKNTSGIDASGIFTTTVRITCKNGDSYLISGLGLELYYDDGCSCKASLTDYFFEPGFSYTFELSVSMNGDPPYHLCTKSAKASKGGITFIVG
ncbi:MAG TPA: hypothetical protein DCZ76_10740 [Treponema sp.]|nr:hypothetical protein [Treponema sp.]